MKLYISKLAALLFRSFCLTQKKQRSQDKPDPSGRFAGPFRTLATVIVVTFLNKLN